MLGMFMMDMGWALKMFLLAGLVFWLAVALICVRRPALPQRYDLDFIKAGLPFLSLLLLVLNMIFYSKAF